VTLSPAAGALGTLAFTGTVTSGEPAGNPVAFVLTATPADLPAFLVNSVCPRWSHQREDGRRRYLPRPVTSANPWCSGHRARPEHRPAVPVAPTRQARAK
jgi:hypothetical protein